MAKRCLILGGDEGGFAMAEELWAEMLWLYVEEDVTDYVVQRFGRIADLAAYVIKKAGARYPALRVVALPWRVDLITAIDESDYLLLCPTCLKKTRRVIEYAQARQAKGKLRIVTVSED